MPSIDFVTANNPAIFGYLQEKDAIPGYVLSSNKITKEEVDRLDKVAFANQAERLYPCHTKEACWESAAYFAGSGESDANVKANIEKMASFHGIEEDVRDVFAIFEGEMNKAAAAEKKEERMEKFALTLDLQGFQGRGVENFYPINNAAEVVSSSDACTADYNAGKIPSGAMRKIASAITEAAITCGVDPSELTGEVRAFGTRNTPDPYAAEILVKMRKSAAHNELMKEFQEKLASTSEISEAIEVANEIAEKMYVLDKQAGVRYGKGVLDPYAILFTGPTLEEFEKAAASTISLRGVNIPVDDFVNLADKDIDVNFSAKSASIIKEAKSYISAGQSIDTCVNINSKLAELNRDTQNVLLNVLANTGW